MVSLYNSSGAGLETALYKWSFSVETRLDSTPVEEGDEAFYFDCNFGNELIFFILLVSVIKKFEDESVGGLFIE